MVAEIAGGSRGSRRRRRMQPRGGGGDRMAVRKGPWTAEEDEVLQRHVREHGAREWSSIRSKGLLPRTGKSCRLRWVNKLRPNLKTGCKFSAEEERVVIDLQAQFGNKWARIATYLPGRTDNDVKNFWSTRQKRLARILRAPLPRRRSGSRQSACRGGTGGASSSSAPSSHDQLLHLHTPEDRDPPCFNMISFQEPAHQHHIGQSSQEPQHTENQSSGAPFPRLLLDLDSILPYPIGFAAMDAAAECSSTYIAAPTAHHHHPHHSLSFLCAGDPAPMADINASTGLVIGAASAGNGGGVAYLEPKLEQQQQQPPQFFGLEEEDDAYGHVGPARRDMPDVLFDDLPPEMFDFFELPPSPPPLPPPHSSPTHL